MHKSVLLLVISVLLCSYANGQSYKEAFRAALDAKDMTKAEEILKAWDLADANDAELYVSYFNFFTVKSQEKDPQTYDKENAGKALEFISEGISRFPTRLDMRIAKIYMLGELEDYPAFTSEVIKMIEYSDKIKNNWKGEDFRLVDKAEDMFFGAILDFQEQLFSKQDATLYKDVIKISEETLKYYPKHTQSRINLSTVYLTQKEYDKSLDVLLKAKEYEPRNAILLYNIAYMYSLKGDKDNAKKHFELVVGYATQEEEELRLAAQKQIEALK